MNMIGCNGVRQITLETHTHTHAEEEPESVLVLRFYYVFHIKSHFVQNRPLSMALTCVILDKLSTTLLFARSNQPSTPVIAVDGHARTQSKQQQQQQPQAS